jgi:hypothetical protein
VRPRFLATRPIMLERARSRTIGHKNGMPGNSQATVACRK